MKIATALAGNTAQLTNGSVLIYALLVLQPHVVTSHLKKSAPKVVTFDTQVVSKFFTAKGTCTVPSTHKFTLARECIACRARVTRECNLPSIRALLRASLKYLFTAYLQMITLVSSY